MKRYMVFNETMVNPCFNGKRFFTANGAKRYALRKVPKNFRAMFQYSVRKVIK